MDAFDATAGGLNRGPVSAVRSKYERKLQSFLDNSVPHVAARWGAFAFVVVLYTVRVLLLKGFYIVTYGIAIFNLNLIIGFLTPAFDPEQEGPTLPTVEAEFKPFVRRVPEFKFWCAGAAGRRERTAVQLEETGTRTRCAAAWPYAAARTLHANAVRRVSRQSTATSGCAERRAPRSAQAQLPQVLPHRLRHDLLLLL